ncbi:hypothetical protein WMY93_014285 [Mugilogobius chulae]|uniref:Ig-like domain-containing protein n=1 Tax=Mugilogobius chulae TaxID=88201 RepID=A0AAW0NU09_9GOBI
MRQQKYSTVCSLECTAAALLLGDSPTDEPLQTVYAFVGFPVILPCRQVLAKNSEVPTIEWSKLDLTPPYVFVYRQNFEVYEEKHRDFQFRTHLFMTELQHGNFSMRLSNVREEDAGTYLCKTIWDKDKQDVKKVELVIVNLPKLKLRLAWTGTGSVDVNCTLHTCSSVVPRLTILDEHGNVLEAEKTPKRGEDSTGCYTVEQRTTATAGTKSVMCRAEFAEVDQSRETLMLIPDLTNKPCTFLMVYSGIGTGLVVLALVGFGLLVHKRCSKHSEKRTLPHQDSDETTISESQPFLRERDQPDSFQIQDETPNTADPHSSTPNSTGSTAAHTIPSVFDVFPGTNNNNNNNEPEQCDINGSESVVFKKEDSRKKLTRQNASSHDSASVQETCQSQANAVCALAIRKIPLMRSQSLPVKTVDLKNIRRNSLSVTKFQQLKEEESE